MFESFRHFIDELAPQPQESPQAGEERLRLAVAVLLAEVMRDDDGITPEEREAVLAALRRQFALDGPQLEQLLALAQQTLRGASDFYQFTSVINERFSRDQRIQVIEAMWRVAYADGHLGTLENSVISRVADLLHLTHGEYIAAKVRVQQERGEAP